MNNARNINTWKSRPFQPGGSKSHGSVDRYVDDVVAPDTELYCLLSVKLKGLSLVSGALCIMARYSVSEKQFHMLKNFLGGSLRDTQIY